MSTNKWKYELRRAGRAAFMGFLGALALAPHPSWLQFAVGATFGLATVWFVDRVSPVRATTRE
jgi:hypothetical protein